MALARIGIGSNVGDGPAQIATALAALETLGRVTARSSLYRSKAWGVVDQPDFTNAAALLETHYEPAALLRELQTIEVRLGRVKTVRWGPRAIDLDMLAYDDRRLDEPELTLPHARLFERAFALVPLAEIDPSYASALAALSQTELASVQRIPVATARTRRAVDWDETLQRVRSAAAFCADAGLARVRIDDGSLAIEVRRAPRPVAPPPLADTGVGPGSAVVASNGALPHDDPPRMILKAEFVGIVRLSRPSVAPGAMLPADRELAYVESLGIRNPIRSGGAGTVIEVFVNDGEAVEYGQPLFALEP